MTKDTQPMRKSAQYAAFDRPKSNRPKKMTKRHLALLVALMASAAPIGLTVAADATTDYDRNKNPRPEKSWHAVEASEAPTTVNIGRLGSENGTSNYKVAPNGVVVPEVFDRIKNTEGYIEMQARTEQQDETFTEYEDRVGTLEGLDRHWNYDPSLDIASAWVTTNDPRITDWAPAIHRQLSGFQQSATFRVSQKRPVEEYEKNYVNGDERLTNIRTEQRTFNETRTRWIDVAIGSWSNTGGLHSCTTWSPATSTKPQGTKFTQSRTCKQKQQRSVSYTVASTGVNPGGAWTDTKTINVSQDRAATGTKVTTGEWFIAGAIGVNSPNPDSDPDFFYGGYTESQWSGAPTYRANKAPWFNTETNKTCQPLGDKFSAYQVLGGGGYRHIYFVVCR